ncbi:hypothetical protein KCU90_g90, partial [Aureobasidium melanogenum]
MGKLLCIATNDLGVMVQEMKHCRRSEVCRPKGHLSPPGCVLASIFARPSPRPQNLQPPSAYASGQPLFPASPDISPALSAKFPPTKLFSLLAMPFLDLSHFPYLQHGMN